jgi:hypothetical protein
MSRAPRRHFLAPFILTAAAALPGCKPKPATTTHDNPPSSSYRSWTVWAGDGECQAEDDAVDDSCPPGASCNPPPPFQTACPEGVTEGQITITQAKADGPCTMQTAEASVEVACPEAIPYEYPEEEDPEGPVEPPLDE